MGFVVSCMVRVEREDAASWESLLRWTQLVDRPLEFHGNLVCTSALSGKAIYCGKDVDLFKALSAINTDTLRGQWFIKAGDMKTLEQRAKEYAHKYRRERQDLGGKEADAVYLGFIEGAKSERAGLTRWRDPKEEVPKEGVDVLIKLITGKCEVGYYIEHVNWRGADGIVDDYIVGWRPIIEDEDADLL